MKFNLKRIYGALTTIIVAVVVILAILLTGVRLIGLTPYVVLSGSMEPQYPVGSLIYVKKTDPSGLKVGDPVTFQLNETTVATHRIIEVIREEEDPGRIFFRTQGDANQIPDGKLLQSHDVIGKPVFSIPFLGYLSNYIQHPPGRYVTIAAGIVIILMVFVPDFFHDEAKTKKNEEKNIKDQEASL